MNKVFISYVRENSEIVDRFCQELRVHGIQVWLDRNDIGPGSRWKRAIRQAIQEGAFFIACFSREYNERDGPYMNEELTIAIEELRQRPIDQAWFIPVKLNECEIPDRDIGGGETLRDLQYVNLYEDWESNLQDILKVVQPASSKTINAITIEWSEGLNAVEEFFKGLTYQNRRNYERAVEHYTEALRLNPQLAEAYINRGNTYLNIGDFDRALSDYTEAIRIKPNFAMAYNNRGNAYAKKGDYDRAIEEYTKAIEINPDSAEAYYNRGNAYYNKDDFNRAIADYTKTIQLNPDDADDYNNRGAAYYSKGDFDHAIIDYTKAIQLNPDHADAYYNRGEAWLHLKEWGKARLDLTAARDMEVDIIASFHNEYESVLDFEQRNEVRLPVDIAEMLTPPQ